MKAKQKSCDIVYIDTIAVATGIVFILNELMTELQLVSLITHLVLYQNILEYCHQLQIFFGG